jgi:hypothetical protein
MKTSENRIPLHQRIEKWLEFFGIVWPYIVANMLWDFPTPLGVPWPYFIPMVMIIQVAINSGVKIWEAPYKREYRMEAIWDRLIPSLVANVAITLLVCVLLFLVLSLTYFPPSWWARFPAEPLTFWFMHLMGGMWFFCGVFASSFLHMWHDRGDFTERMKLRHEEDLAKQELGWS